MHVLVTGAAGFVGSTLVDRALALGWRVRGIDSFADYYPRSEKVANTAAATEHDAFEMVKGDLMTHDLGPVLDGIDVVFHLAGQPGVRGSWAEGFDPYLTNNVHATQRLLEAAVTASTPRFVYASSSSVYGATTSFPTNEQQLPAPRSPYGVTKLAGEHLVGLYAANHDLTTVALRYFTVYGPRQRPDMATHRLLHTGLTGGRFELFGNGDAVRDFTFVGDVAEANVLAATADVSPGSVMNVAGGSSVSMNELIAAAEHAVGAEIDVVRTGVAKGDVSRTEASTEQARKLLGWAPQVDLTEGLRLQAHEVADRLGLHSTV